MIQIQVIKKHRQKSPIYNKIKKAPPKKSPDFKCEHCFSYFTRKDSLKKHLLYRCKVKKQQEHDKEQETLQIIQELQNKVNQLEKQMANNNNNGDINSHNTINNTNITNNNINLVAFGNEDLSYITNEDAIKLLERGDDSTILLIREVHYNGDRPDHHNVYVSNDRSTNAVIYNGNGWVIKDKQEIINRLYNGKNKYLKDKYEELYDELDNEAIDKFDDYLRIRNHKVTKKKKHKAIERLMYNQKEKPVGVRQQMDKRKVIK